MCSTETRDEPLKKKAGESERQVIQHRRGRDNGKGQNIGQHLCNQLKKQLVWTTEKAELIQKRRY